MCAFAKPADFELHERRYYMVGRTAGGVRSLEGQMVNFQRLNYARIYARRCGVNSLRARSALVLYEQTRISATRLVWTAVILNSSETGRPPSNGRALNVQLSGVYKNFFGGQKGVRANPLEPPRTPSNPLEPRSGVH